LRISTNHGAQRFELRPMLGSAPAITMEERHARLTGTLALLLTPLLTASTQ
jgi:hypothetical protein